MKNSPFPNMKQILLICAVVALVGCDSTSVDDWDGGVVGLSSAPTVTEPKQPEKPTAAFDYTFNTPDVGSVIKCETRLSSQTIGTKGVKSTKLFTHLSYDLHVLEKRGNEVTKFELRNIKSKQMDRLTRMEASLKARNNWDVHYTEKGVGRFQGRSKSKLGLDHFVNFLWNAKLRPKSDMRVGNSYVVAGNYTTQEPQSAHMGNGDGPLTVAIKSKTKNEIILKLSINQNLGFRNDNFTGFWEYDRTRKINKKVSFSGLAKYYQGTEIRIDFLHTEEIVKLRTTPVTEVGSPPKSGGARNCLY